MTVTDSHVVAKARQRGEKVRDLLADLLALARGPTTVSDAREAMPHSVSTSEIAFQFDRMTEEGRTVKDGSGRFALAEG